MKSDQAIVPTSRAAEIKVIGSIWRRAVWMRLGALNGLFALAILLLSEQALPLSEHSGLLRQAAQIQFMHGMATLACATFMNIGAICARYAPGFFLSGIVLYCMPIYGEAIGIGGPVNLIKPAGLVAFVAGWLILAWSARDIDKT